MRHTFSVCGLGGAGDPIVMVANEKALLLVFALSATAKLSIALLIAWLDVTDDKADTGADVSVAEELLWFAVLDDKDICKLSAGVAIPIDCVLAKSATGNDITAALDGCATTCDCNCVAMLIDALELALFDTEVESATAPG